MMTDCSQPSSSVADVYAKNYTLCRTSPLSIILYYPKMIGL